MKIVFFGSSEFAVPSLKRLIDSGHEVVCVVTQPDRKKGRHLLFSATSVKSAALKANLKISQPEKIDTSFIEFLKKFESDIFVVISYGLILPKSLLSIPKKLSINVHASLLPKYRGAAPINWAIIKGEKTTGITIIRMNEKMDEGEIISSKETSIENNDTSETLSEKLSKIAPDLLLKTIKEIENDKAVFNSQDHRKVSYAPKLNKKDGLIDWSKTAIEIYNQVRGTVPWPGSFTSWQGKLLKIYKAGIIDEKNSDYKFGEIIEASKDRILVATGKGSLNIELLQLESGNKMQASQFICGHKIKKGDLLI